MEFLFFAFVFLIFDVLVLWYLTGSTYFSPWTADGSVDVWNVMVFVVMVSVGIGIAVTIIIFLGEKFLIYGRKEFPPAGRAIRVGLAAAVLCGLLITLHIFHFLSLVVAIGMCVLVIIGIILLR
jgi:hypothetical protein